MKNLTEYINSGESFPQVDDDMRHLLGVLLGQFVQGKVDIKEKNDKDLVRKAKIFLFDIA